MIRKLEPHDIPLVLDLFERMGYDADPPHVSFSAHGKMEGMEAALVRFENGRLVGFVGAQKCVEIIGIFDKGFETPRQRLEMIRDFYEPMIAVLKRGYRFAYAWAENKRFGERMQDMGWQSKRPREMFIHRFK